MNSKVLLAFLIGAGVGGLTTYVLFKEKLEKEYEEAINEEIDGLIEIYAGKEIDEIDSNGMTEEEYEERVAGITRKYCPGAEANEMRKNMIYRKPDLNKVPYDAITKSSAGKEQGLLDPIDCTVPRVITINDFTDDCQNYEKLSLYYYDDDDTLIDDKEEIISGVESLVGDALTRFGDGSNDPDIVYVRNDVMACDYEIVRYYRSYQVEILGLPSDEVKKRRKLNDGGNAPTDD